MQVGRPCDMQGVECTCAKLGLFGFLTQFFFPEDRGNLVDKHWVLKHSRGLSANYCAKLPDIAEIL